MRAVLIGPPGSGKGTQADFLRDRLGIAVVGMGDILRQAAGKGTPLGNKVKPYLESGQFAPDDLVNAVVAEKMRQPDRPERFVLDGYPRNAAQAATLDALLNDLGLGLTAVIHFQIDEEVVVRRMLARKRADDNEHTIRQRLQVYRDTARELVNHYRKQGIVHDVNADLDREQLYVTAASILLSTKR